MTTDARVLADSENARGDRLVTLEVTFPRFILAEFNTHRVFSRNSASSRAIPVQKQILHVMERPFVPKRFPINRPGMSAVDYIDEDDPRYVDCLKAWMEARVDCVKATEMLMQIGVHKQIASRLLEPFMWHTVIVSSTEWDNFFKLRISEFAQPEIKEAAERMRAAMDYSQPELLTDSQWHLPLIDGDERETVALDTLIKCSVARCAAVSYNRHADRDVSKELKRYQGLAENGHLSPFEHAAIPNTNSYTWANFRGWQQARWFIEQGVKIT